MHKLLEKLDHELHKYADKEGELKPEEWKVVFDAIEARKDLLTSMAMEGEDQYGNYESDRSSGRSHPIYRYSGMYEDGRMMDPNRSYSSGRRYNMRGYSGHNDPKNRMLDKLYESMDMAETEDERQMIQKCINKLEY